MPTRVAVICFFSRAYCETMARTPRPTPFVLALVAAAPGYHSVTSSGASMSIALVEKPSLRHESTLSRWSRGGPRLLFDFLSCIGCSCLIADHWSLPPTAASVCSFVGVSTANGVPLGTVVRCVVYRCESATCAPGEIETRVCTEQWAYRRERLNAASPPSQQHLFSSETIRAWTARWVQANGNILNGMVAFDARRTKGRRTGSSRSRKTGCLQGEKKKQGDESALHQ